MNTYHVTIEISGVGQEVLKLTAAGIEELEDKIYWRIIEIQEDAGLNPVEGSELREWIQQGIGVTIYELSDAEIMNELGVRPLFDLD